MLIFHIHGGWQGKEARLVWRKEEKGGGGEKDRERWGRTEGPVCVGSVEDNAGVFIIVFGFRLFYFFGGSVLV